MTAEDYREILAAVETALEACTPCDGFMEDMDRKICDELREARAQVLRLIAADSNPPLDVSER